MYVITGRSDDVMNVSGHRLGSAEIESALVSHPKIAEAAVCSFPHPIKGEGIYALPHQWLMRALMACLTNRSWQSLSHG